MHSSRMRTTRSLTACHGGHAWQGTCMAVGHAWQGACMAVGHAWQGGMHGGVLAWQACSPVNRMTDTCENITLPQTSFAGGNKKKRN